MKVYDLDMTYKSDGALQASYLLSFYSVSAPAAQQTSSAIPPYNKDAESPSDVYSLTDSECLSLPPCVFLWQHNTQMLSGFILSLFKNFFLGLYVYL